MILRALVLLFALAGPLGAETARIASGEHADFTRLVVQLPAEAGWTVGRMPMGYAFATDGTDQPDYDLTRVWDRIPRKRLQALRVDPETGALLLALACPCHVFPFEYQPGMIVLDIREGPPPAGSTFEAPFAMGSDPGVASLESGLGPPVAFDWVEHNRGHTAMPRSRPKLELDAGTLSLDPLRNELLEQISRGAAQGIVDMRLPGKPAKVPASEEDVPWAQIYLGEMPGLDVVDPNARRAALQPDGSPCVSDGSLAIGDWGGGRPPLDLISEARAGLYGEFDVVQPEAVLTSVRLHLYLGFGAEARQYAALLPEVQGDLRLLTSMARLVDGDVDPEAPFASMLACDSAAAFWAVLAHDRLPPGAMVDSDAVVRTFLGLPPHLRSLFGPRLASLLLDRDAEAARRIRNAMERTPYVPPETVSLLDARAELQADRPDQARTHAEDALTGPWHEAEALIALVEAHFREERPLQDDVVGRIQSLQRETGSDDRLDRAVLLALALSGRFVEAFESADPGPVTADIWRVLAARAEDDTLLAHAVLPKAVPPVAAEVSLDIARRLAGLGFPDAALEWLGPIGPEAPTERRLVGAAAELSRGNARQALDHLAGLEGEVAGELRAQAQTRLGFLDAAMASLEAVGKPEEAARIAVWTADWSDVADAAMDPWAKAASMVDPMAPEGGALARGAALLEDSSAARAALAELLAAVPAPTP